MRIFTAKMSWTVFSDIRDVSDILMKVISFCPCNGIWKIQKHRGNGVASFLYLRRFSPSNTSVEECFYLCLGHSRTPLR